MFGLEIFRGAILLWNLISYATRLKKRLHTKKTKNNLKLVTNSEQNFIPRHFWTKYDWNIPFQFNVIYYLLKLLNNLKLLLGTVPLLEQCLPAKNEYTEAGTEPKAATSFPRSSIRFVILTSVSSKHLLIMSTFSIYVSLSVSSGLSKFEQISRIFFRMSEVFEPCNMAIPVVEFSREEYKIKKVLG